MNTMPGKKEPDCGDQWDQPVPATVGPLTDMMPGEIWKARLAQAALALVLGAIAFAVYVNNHTFWTVVFGLGAAFFLVLIFLPNSKVATCFFCGHRNIGLVIEDEKKELQCKRCHEYLIADRRSVRAMPVDTISETPEFVALVFDGTVWPNACVACGATPTRYDELTSTSMNVAALALGRVRAMSAKVSGVPYCDQPKGCVTFAVRQDRTLELKWSSLRMMRRYLAVNRSREAMRTHQ